MTSNEPESPVLVACLNNETPTSSKTSTKPRIRRGSRVAKLIGKRCTLTCYLNGVKTDMLLDSGAQVTILEKSWIETHLPHVKIQSLDNLLPDNPLRVTAANGTDLPFEGWVEILVEIKSAKHGRLAIHAPMLVSQRCVSGLLLGFNVIEEIILESLKDPGSVSLSDLLAETMKLKTNTAETLVSVISETPTETETPTKTETLSTTVKVGKKGLTIPSGQISQVKCHIRSWPAGGTMMFEPNMWGVLPEGLDMFAALVDVSAGSSKTVRIPVHNPTKHDIFLPQRSILGYLEEIMDSKPVQFGSNPQQSPNAATSDTQLCSAQIQKCSSADEIPDVDSPTKTHSKEKWHPPVNLEHLDEQQQKAVRQMLHEESDVFAREEGDIGCIPNLQLKINVEDNKPVQKSYNSIPKPLYKEVKEYVQNLLDRGWIHKSVSSYSSPVVCVRKKDQSLRLCVDFRGLNQKTIPDRHPLPRIQDLLDSLGGNTWFSILDQGSAYHQAKNPDT